MMKKACSKCNIVFLCESACWCGDFPRIMPLDPTRGCLCRNCLKNELLDKIEGWMNPLTHTNSIKIKELGRPEKLIEDIDYTLNSKGQMVFSSWYLMRRGHCCGNGCTNCPYGKIFE